MVKSKILSRKTTIITGGSRGIGLRIAEALAKKKYNIVICSRHLKELKRAKKVIENYGVTCLTLKTDVSNYNHCKKLIKRTIKAFKRIDVLVNNAGIQGPIGPLWKNKIKAWEETIKINLLGTFYLCHLVVPHMLKLKSGVIINLSGGGAAYTRPLFSAYSSSKTALVRLTENLAAELKGKNISVFAIAPGGTFTKMVEQVLKMGKGQISKQEEKILKEIKKTKGTTKEQIESLINFLMTKKASEISGKLIHVSELNKILNKIGDIKTESGLLRRVSFSIK